MEISDISEDMTWQEYCVNLDKRCDALRAQYLGMVGHLDERTTLLETKTLRYRIKGALSVLLD